MDMIMQSLVNRHHLTPKQTHQMLTLMMEGQLNPTKAGAYLALWESKGVTTEELQHAISAILTKAVAFKKLRPNAIDTAGTGGSGISTFNISTCTAIAAAAAGLPIIKHGNHSHTRVSGSADVLKSLEVNIDLTTEQAEQCFEELNLCFCYAIKHHVAMANCAQVRKDLEINTIFNLIGPLANPAGVKNQLVGVCHACTAGKIIHALMNLGHNRVIVVSNDDGLCELTTTAVNEILMLEDGIISSNTIDAKSLGLGKGNLQECCVSSSQESANMILRIFEGKEESTPFQVALLNIAATLVLGQKVGNFADGIDLARDLIKNGHAMQKLQDLVHHTQKFKQLTEC